MTAKARMRYGFWLPVFGGWLRNVDDEQMEASWEYVRDLAKKAEAVGYDLTLIAELNLNDIKGVEAASLDAWSTTAALAAVTEKLELMVAVRPTFHNPALLAKQAASVDQMSHGRLTLNVVSSWWKDEATKYGVHFDEHDDRYARTSEWLDVVDGCWKTQKIKEVKQLIADCSGLWLEAVTRTAYAVQGDSLGITVTINNRLNAPLSVAGVSLSDEIGRASCRERV